MSPTTVPPGSRHDDRRPGMRRPAPTLGGELRGSALLFALTLAVTVGAAAAARVLTGLAP